VYILSHGEGLQSLIAVVCRELFARSYRVAVCMVPELVPVLGSQPAGDVSHKPGGKLPLLSARPT